MKTAREMFEQLGYELEENDYPWLTTYIKRTRFFELKIVFNHIERTIYLHNTYKDIKEHTRFECSIELLEVIHSQMKELGWLDE